MNRRLVALGVALFVVATAPSPAGAASWRHTTASWYGPCPDACGRAACTGKFIHPGTWGVANKTLPCGTKVTVCANGRCLHARVIDRGPFVSGRDLDITVRPAGRIGLTPSAGILRVKWRIGWPAWKERQ